MTTAELSRYMVVHHRGPDNAQPNSVIALQLGFRDLGTNGRAGLLNSHEFTLLCTQALEEAIPIIFNSDGYFYALNRSDFDAFIHHADKLIADWTKKRDAALNARQFVQNDVLDFDNE